MLSNLSLRKLIRLMSDFMNEPCGAVYILYNVRRVGGGYNFCYNVLCGVGVGEYFVI